MRSAKFWIFCAIANERKNFSGQMIRRIKDGHRKVIENILCRMQEHTLGTAKIKIINNFDTF